MCVDFCFSVHPNPIRPSRMINEIKHSSIRSFMIDTIPSIVFRSYLNRHLCSALLVSAEGRRR